MAIKRTRQELARRVLWDDREMYLPHLFRKCCGIAVPIEGLCETAGWTFESYLLAAFFDTAELLVEVTK